MAAVQMHQAMLKALPYFEDISLVFAPNIRCKAGGKHFFFVPMYCTGSTAYLAGRYVKKSDLIPRSEVHFLHLKRVSFDKYY